VLATVQRKADESLFKAPLNSRTVESCYLAIIETRGTTLRILVWLIGISALLIEVPANIANAADMALKAPPPADANSWTGYYFGINGGYGWSQSTPNDTYCITMAGMLNGGTCDLPNNGFVRPGGSLFGGQAGYNLQSGSIVSGLEADIQWSSIKDANSIAETTPGRFDTGSSDLDWFGSLRGRLGILASPRSLLYATAGLIYGGEKVSFNLIEAPLVSYPSNSSVTRGGWTGGGGFEYAFTGHFSGKIEGLYYDLGSSNIISSPNPLNGRTEGAIYKFTGGIVRAGLNYNFGGTPDRLR
jgi:outer membrane immunogenic protein